MVSRSNRHLPIRVTGAALALGTALAAPPARAIPAFARKYETSCLTCHVVFPKLNPFGEAFRRNGYRFPGVDSDYVKQPTVALGQEANKKTFPSTVWPASIPSSVPLSVGGNGEAAIVPSRTSSAGRQEAAGGRPFSGVSLQDLVAEGHLWAGAALDDSSTLWGELTFGSDGSVDVEHLQLLLQDLLGPKHAVNVSVGHGFPTVTPFGPHSSYVADLAVTNLPVTGIYGTSPDPWVVADNFTGLEVNGVVAGRFGYSLGLNADKAPGEVRFPSESVYGHVAWKLGGMSLDGEGSTGPPDALRPWAETSLTPYVFAYHSNAWWSTAAPSGFQNDPANTLGGGLRAQLASLELDAGHYRSRHDHGTDALGKVTANVTFGELSYVVYPWLVPAVRIERASLAPAGGSTASDWHVMPGVAFLVRPNVRVLAVASWEHADGFPATAAGPVPWDGGAADWGPLLAAPPPSGASSVSELETFAVFLQWAI